MLFSNLAGIYESLSSEGRHEFLGSIFPEKLVFDGNSVRTASEDSITALFGGKTQKMKDADPSKEVSVLSGSPGRIRTYNPAVNSRMLYR